MCNKKNCTHIEQKFTVELYEKKLVKSNLPQKCNDRQQNFLQKAAQIAIKSNMTHSHGTIIVLNNEIISTGYNKTTVQCHHVWSIHSEVDALLKIKKNIDLSNAEMYVVRIGKNTDLPLKMSRPCTGCQDYILKRGIGKVYYSFSDIVDYGEFKKTKLQYKNNKTKP